MDRSIATSTAKLSNSPSVTRYIFLGQFWLCFSVLRCAAHGASVSASVCLSAYLYVSLFRCIAVDDLFNELRNRTVYHHYIVIVIVIVHRLRPKAALIPITSSNRSAVSPHFTRHLTKIEIQPFHNVQDRLKITAIFITLPIKGQNYTSIIRISLSSTVLIET